MLGKREEFPSSETSLQEPKPCSGRCNLAKTRSGVPKVAQKRFMVGFTVRSYKNGKMNGEENYCRLAV